MSSEIVFDLETEKSFDEVGGRENFHLLGVTVVSIYNYADDTFTTFEKHELAKLEKLLTQTERLIGFNIRHFDLPVLAPHVSINLSHVLTLDLMDDVERSAGFRISLDNLSKMTLGAQKSGHGMDAIYWWREGKKDQVKKYCEQDVRLTRDLYEFGKRHGQVFFESRATRSREPLQVSWGNAGEVKDVRSILQQGFRERKSVEIVYEVKSAEGPKEKRLVDIYTLNHKTFEGYCHLREAKRIFTIEGVRGAKITNHTYKLEHDVQQSLI